jgi:hypothetical protein
VRSYYSTAAFGFVSAGGFGGVSSGVGVVFSFADGVVESEHRVGSRYALPSAVSFPM